MKRNLILLGIVLFVMGFAGVLSLLTMDFKIPDEAAALIAEKFTPMQFKLVTLINPTVLMIIAIVVGIVLHKKVALGAPVIESLISKEKVNNLKGILFFGLIGGIFAGLLIELAKLVFMQIVPAEFAEISQNLQYTLAARFLYGGITEEILMRFGLMTFLVWLASKIIKSGNNINYWTGIVLSSLIFAIGHFPAVFQSVENPSMAFLSYIVLGNSIGGLAFGWLYWKKGLEAAMIAHIFAHVVMVIATML